MTVLDVAQYILDKDLDKTGVLDTNKLQKLCYYAQVGSLYIEEVPLFDEPIEAWVWGPVIPALDDALSGEFEVDFVPGGRSENLDVIQQDIIDAVIERCGDWNAEELTYQTRQESPWIEARESLKPYEDGHRIISIESIQRWIEQDMWDK